MSHEEFRSRMGRRLGVDLNEGSPFPFSFQIMNVSGARSESRMAGADRHLLHNQQRDTVHRQAAAGGARPELESGGSLGELGVSGRRLADTLLCAAMGVKTSLKSAMFSSPSLSISLPTRITRMEIPCWVKLSMVVIVFSTIDSC